MTRSPTTQKGSPDSLCTNLPSVLVVVVVVVAVVVVVLVVVVVVVVVVALVVVSDSTQNRNVSETARRTALTRPLRSTGRLPHSQSELRIPLTCPEISPTVKGNQPRKSHGVTPLELEDV